MNKITKLVVQLENARDEGDLHKAEEIQWQIDMLNAGPRTPVLSEPVKEGTSSGDLSPWGDSQ